MTAASGHQIGLHESKYVTESRGDAAIAELRIVGAVVLVAREGELVYRSAAALADRLGENRSPSVPNNGLMRKLGLGAQCCSED